MEVYAGLGVDRLETMTTSDPYEHQLGFNVIEVNGFDFPVAVDNVVPVRCEQANKFHLRISETSVSSMGCVRVQGRYWSLTAWRRVKCLPEELYFYRYVRYWKCGSRLIPAIVVGYIRYSKLPFVWESVDVFGDILGSGRDETLDRSVELAQASLEPVFSNEI